MVCLTSTQTKDLSNIYFESNTLFFNNLRVLTGGCAPDPLVTFIAYLSPGFYIKSISNLTLGSVNQKTIVFYLEKRIRLKWHSDLSKASAATFFAVWIHFIYSFIHIFIIFSYRLLKFIFFFSYATRHL